jgi:hypothetical protein
MKGIYFFEMPFLVKINMFEIEKLKVDANKVNPFEVSF